jgi:hypothetical protein
MPPRESSGQHIQLAGAIQATFWPACSSAQPLMLFPGAGCWLSETSTHTLTCICTSASGDSICSIQRELTQQALQQDCCSEVSWATWRLPAQQHSSDSLPAYIEQLVSSRRPTAAWRVQRRAQRLQPASKPTHSIGRCRWCAAPDTFHSASSHGRASAQAQLHLHLALCCTWQGACSRISATAHCNQQQPCTALLTAASSPAAACTSRLAAAALTPTPPPPCPTFLPRSTSSCSPPSRCLS